MNQFREITLTIHKGWYDELKKIAEKEDVPILHTLQSIFDIAMGNFLDELNKTREQLKKQEENP